MTFELDISNTGRLRATNLGIRIVRPTANQFAAFPLAVNPPGTTTGDQAMGYSWTTVGDPANSEGEVFLAQTLLSGETVGLGFTLFLDTAYVPGVTLQVTSSLTSGGCGD